MFKSLKKHVICVSVEQVEECTSGANGRSLKGSSDERIERDIFLLEEVEVTLEVSIGCAI